MSVREVERVRVEGRNEATNQLTSISYKPPEDPLQEQRFHQVSSREQRIRLLEEQESLDRRQEGEEKLLPRVGEEPAERKRLVAEPEDDEKKNGGGKRREEKEGKSAARLVSTRTNEKGKDEEGTNVVSLSGSGLLLLLVTTLSRSTVALLNLSLSVGVSSFSPFRANDEEKVVSEELGSLNHGFLGSTERGVE